MNRRNLRKISKFVNESEDFFGKSILLINLDKSENFLYLENLEKNVDLNYLFDKFNTCNKDVSYIKESKNIKFDFVIIYNSTLSIIQESFLCDISYFENYFKNGSKVFVFYENKQNVFKYIKRIILNKSSKSSLLKRKNLNSNERYYVYDYFYFSNYKNMKFLSILKFILIWISNSLDLQRFFYLSSNILVKYLYLK